MTSHVVVVGGGLAGLTAAATLSTSGHSVTLFDGASDLGGRARSRRQHGFSMNLGPHALYRAGGGRAVLRDLGVSIRGKRPRLDRAGVRIGGAHLPVASVVRRAGDRRQVVTAMAGLSARARRDWVGRSAREWVDTVTDDPAGRAIIESAIRTATYSADLTLLEAAAATTQLRLAAVHGVLYLHGGWSSLTDGLEAVVRSHGGVIETGVRVDAVDHDDETVRGVTLADGRTHRADAVVLAVNDPRRAASLLHGVAAERLNSVAADVVPLRMAHLDVALRPPTSARFPNLLGLDEETYLVMPSSVVQDAPDGAAIVHVGRYLRPGEEHLDHRPALEAVLDEHQPGWRDHLVDARFVPRSLVSGDHCRVATRGSLDRVPTDGTGVPGLAVAGDWVGPTGMLADAAIVSGARAATDIAAVLDGRRPRVAG
jgi:phytoene dehydrogenase-like protein